MLKEKTVVSLFVALVLIAPFVSAQEAKQFPTGSAQADDSAHRAERDAMYYRYLDLPSYVKGGTVEPQWLGDGDSFWYADSSLPGSQGSRLLLVDARRNTEREVVGVKKRNELLSSLPGDTGKTATPRVIANAGFSGRSATEVPSPDGRMPGQISRRTVPE